MLYATLCRSVEFVVLRLKETDSNHYCKTRLSKRYCCSESCAVNKIDILKAKHGTTLNKRRTCFGRVLQDSSLRSLGIQMLIHFRMVMKR